jgi:membrane protease YdiL (CAAX protease family)
MGILLGFFRYHSRQLWPGIAAHFFNNAINIILAYYALNLPNTPDWIKPDYRISEPYAAASLIIGLLLIYLFNSKYNPTN